MGLHLAGRGFVSVEHIIALTWRMRAADDTSQVSRVGRRRYRTAKNLQWSSEETDREDQAPLPGETWSPLKYKCGIVSCDRSYEISNKGRLRSPHSGLITSGFYFAGSRWAAVKDCGLVDLLVASGMHEPPEPHPPCIKDALTCMMSGDHPEDMLPFTNATEKSLWSYFTRGIEFAEPSELKMVWPLLVPDSLVRVLKDLKRAGDPVWGDSLTALMPVVTARLPADSDFHDSEFQWEMLRFARACLVATTRA
jgi:hypothetical protein